MTATDVVITLRLGAGEIDVTPATLAVFAGVFLLAGVLDGGITRWQTCCLAVGAAFAVLTVVALLW